MAKYAVFRFVVEPVCREAFNQEAERRRMACRVRSALLPAVEHFVALAALASTLDFGLFFELVRWLDFRLSIELVRSST
eukprot:2730065-Prymnesium_polylepis.1